MDFWSRLIGGSSAERRAARIADPQRRLALFKRVYGLILQTWQKTKSLPSNEMALDAIRMYMEQLASILNEESRSPAPHLALSFSASSQIYVTVSRIACTAYNETIIKRAVSILSALVESEEEEFVWHQRFAESVTHLVDRVLSSGSIAVGEDTLSEIVELLFGIVAKIRLQPTLLPVWFIPKSLEKGSSNLDGAVSGPFTPTKVGFAGETQKEDFPLCYYLIDHVHHEGRIGDFARTGLLYIFETASKYESLEEWLVGSDIPTLMATGLGALYSQLSRKLSIIHPRVELPIVLQLSDYPPALIPAGTESLFEPDFQVQFDTFLSHLAFWQDVLEHCKSTDVRQTLLDHFQVLYLQQLLYPSLLESSDVDGGSAVAVLTYLRRIIDALDHPELVHMILEYLLALSAPAQLKPPSTPPKSPSQAKRRMSLALLNQIDKDEDRLDPSLFSLADLIISSTSSHNTQTVIAALKLVTVIFAKNHIYAVGTLVRTTPSRAQIPRRTHGGLEAEVDRYLGIVEELGDDADLDEAYENHLRDVQVLVETHPCSAKKMALDDLALPAAYRSSMELICMKPVDPHYINPDDSLLNNLLELVKSFLTNNVETNLGLTETIITLGCCTHVRLEGWLAVDPSGYDFSASNGDLDLESMPEPVRKAYQARQRPSWPSQANPRILEALEHIRSQIAHLRTLVPDLNQLVNSRKQAFRVHEEINAAVQSPGLYNSLNRTLASETPPSGTQTPQRQSTSIPQRLRDDSASSRTQSPSGSSPPRSSIERKPVLPPRPPSQSPAPSSRSSNTLLGSPPPSDYFGGRPKSPAPPSIASTMRISTDVVNRPILSDIVQAADTEALKRKIRFPLTQDENGESRVGAQATDEEDHAPQPVEVSLSHVLTNVVILQEFVMELAALMQVRASLFQEVQFHLE